MPGRRLQATIVALLAAIWLEVGGFDTLAHAWRDAAWFVSSIGKPKEEPAPAKHGQASGMHFDNSAEVDALAKLPPIHSPPK